MMTTMTMIDLLVWHRHCRVRAGAANVEETDGDGDEVATVVGCSPITYFTVSVHSSRACVSFVM